MIDLTDNKTPFGLLTPEEQEHLRNWPHGVEVYNGSRGWLNCKYPLWGLSTTYRTKPAPAKRVHWTNDYEGTCSMTWYNSRDDAGRGANRTRTRIAVIRREWIEGQAPQYFVEEV